MKPKPDLADDPTTKRVLSVNVGTPTQVKAGGRTVLTSIFKSPVPGTVAVRRHNLAGDRQSDLRVHGGPYKAVYCYAAEHYGYWCERLSRTDLSAGAFGENLTTQGLTEETAHIGEQFRIGSAILQVTQPRMPCFKLAIRLDRADMVKQFWLSGRSGIYFSVVEEGDVATGDRIESVTQCPHAVTVADVVRLYRGEETSADLLGRALRSPLFGSWKRELQERLL